MNNSIVRAIPEGMHSLTPYLICDGAANAMSFYKQAFSAVEVSRVTNGHDKVLNAQVRIGNSLLMLMDEFVEFGALGPNALKGTPVTIHLQVENVDAVVEQAVSAGAKIKMPIKDEFWGDRIAVLEDPFGHSWAVATHVRDVSPEELKAHAKKAMTA